MLSRSKVFRQKIEGAVIFFYLLASPAETAYLSVRERHLSNAGIRPRKDAVHTFLGWSQVRMLRRPLYWNYRKP